MANKNMSESGNSPNRSRTRAAAKPAAQRAAVTTVSSSRQSGGDGDARIDTAPDMVGAANADEPDLAYEEIAKAAYLRFLSRGGQNGADLDDWVEAERELRSRRFR